MESTNQKIIPHLWFDKEAKEAADFYVSAFGGDSKFLSARTIEDTPSGDAEMVSFRLLGYDFLAISAGPFFRFNPSVSFFVNFDPSQNSHAETDLKSLWEKLADGGSTLMPLQAYPFSRLYGWIQDRYGLSWQLILTNPTGEIRPAIVPSLMFVGDMCGRAEEARVFYTSVFKNSREGIMARYGADMPPDREGTVMFEDFMLLGQWFGAMDSARVHDFGFNEAVSFLVSCENQKEIDYYWEKLSAVPESEQCGWLKDRYGLSWQITPSAMKEMMKGTSEQRKRVTEAFLKMKKFDIAELERAFEGS